MIVDVHSHAWDERAHLSESFRRQSARASGVAQPRLATPYEAYHSAAPADVVRIAFGGKARLSGLWVDDAYVADYVARAPGRTIGFLSVDPTQPGWEDELSRGHEELGLRGVKLLPMYAGFRPDDDRLADFWAYTEQRGLPVLLHTGTTFVAEAPLECTLPRHLDAVARAHPEQRLILAHLSHPFEGECVAVIRKHANAYADLSALHPRPFQLYHSLMLVQEYGVWDKVLFGTDFPFTTVEDTVAGLRALNGMLEGTRLPRLDEEAIERLVFRDTLPLLGLT